MQHEDFPARVRGERKARGWTQSQMAEAVGMSLRAYQGFETRKNVPQPENLRRISEVAGIDLNGEEGTQETWDPEVQAFLDMMGAYLTYGVAEDRRRAVIHDLTRQIFQAN